MKVIKQMKNTTAFTNHTSITNLLNPFNSVNDALHLLPGDEVTNLPEYMCTLTAELCHYAPSIEFQLIVKIKKNCLNVEVIATDADEQ